MSTNEETIAETWDEQGETQGRLTEGEVTHYPQPMTPVQRIIQAMDDLKAIRTFVANELKEGLDFGTIPGTSDKKVLLLPGAQKICMYFNVRPIFRVKRIEIGIGKPEYWGHLEVYVETDIVSRDSGKIVGAGVGSCSTMETKYRYRKMERTCPNCGKATIHKGKKFKPTDPETWFCWKKKGGCGATFNINDPEIINQEEGQKENENIHDQRNTCLKMSKKRSLIDATIGLGCLSELFTQDLDDFFDLEVPKEKPPEQSSQKAPEEPKSEAGASLLDQASEELLKCEDFTGLLRRFEQDETAAHRFGVWSGYVSLKETAFRALRDRLSAEPLVPIPTGYEPFWLEFYALDEAYRRGNREEANRIFFSRKDKIPGDAWVAYARELKGAVKQ